MPAVDPIFVAPRLVQRDWGRTDLGQWLRKVQRPDDTVAEAWLLDSANVTDAGPLGRRISRQPKGILGDVGRAPPKIRMIFPGEPVLVKPASPLSFFTILEPGVSSPLDLVGYRPGGRIRVYEGANVTLAAGSVALEVGCAFLPTNQGQGEKQIICLPPVSQRARATLFRDTGLSVETWRLPEWSRVVPDGETCHALVALGEAVRIDGRSLTPGETVLVPACGRPLDIVSEVQGAKLLVVYPDRTPTDVWRHTPGPDPAGGQLPKPEPAQPPVWTTATLQPAMAA